MLRPATAQQCGKGAQQRGKRTPPIKDDSAQGV